MSATTLITHIGELITNDPVERPARRPARCRRGRRRRVEGDRVAWVGRAADAPAADAYVDAGGRAAIPGFVDSHSHLVFAGDRAQEFAARMTGEPYTAGGIRTTVAATRAATDEQLTLNVARLVSEMRRSGTTTVEIKSGYGLTVHDEARGLAVARQFTDETTFLGAHVVPSEHAGDPGGYVDLVTGPMLDAAAPYATWIDVFCETGAFDEDQARAILDAGEAGPPRPPARQPAGSRPRGPPGSRAWPGRRRPLHLPHRRRRRRAQRLRNHRDPAPGRGVLDAAALPGRAPADRRRRPRRDRQRLQPRLVLHLLDAAVRGPGGPRDADEPCGGRARRHEGRRGRAGEGRYRGARARKAGRSGAARGPVLRPSRPTDPASTSSPAFSQVGGLLGSAGGTV